MAVNVTGALGSVAACLCICVPAAASDSLLAIMRSCEAQADDAARLRCYDAGIARFNTASAGAGGREDCSVTGLSAPAASQPTPGTQADTAPQSNSADRFGLT